MEGKHIGWIGTGVMGKSMCKLLLKNNFKLTVFNRTASKADELLELGATFSTPEEMAPQVDVIVLMVGYPQDLRNQLFERDLLGKMKPGALLIDHTTSSPGLAEEIAERASKFQIESQDAPVSGGDIGAQNGTLAIMTGGSQKGFDIAKPIFDCYGKTATLLGKAGCGQHTKMANQIALAGAIIGVCEALLYGHKAGLDLKQVLETISGGAAASFQLTNFAPRILKRDLGPGFYVEHFVKDLEIALDECRRMNFALPGLALVHQLYKSLQAYDGDRLGHHALIKVLENMNNLEMKKYDF